MSLVAFKAVRRNGIHCELADLAVKRLRSANLAVKGQKEKDFERSVVAHLQASSLLKKNLITQIGIDEVEKIQSASLFGFKHRPDTAIGLNGTAIEIKVISGGSDVRDILGQAIAYRMDYRFVILVLVDLTGGHQIVELCRNKKSRENVLLSKMAQELNVFSIIGPLAQSKNLVIT